MVGRRDARPVGRGVRVEPGRRRDPGGVSEAYVRLRVARPGDAGNPVGQKSEQGESRSERSWQRVLRNGQPCGIDGATSRLVGRRGEGWYPSRYSSSGKTHATLADTTRSGADVCAARRATISCHVRCERVRGLRPGRKHVALPTCGRHGLSAKGSRLKIWDHLSSPSETVKTGRSPGRTQLQRTED